MVLGRSTSGHLREIDLAVRKSVRQWLRLPKDVPIAYMYAPVREGGMGIPCLENMIPRLTLVRMRRLADSSYEAAREAYSGKRVQRKINWATKALRTLGLDYLNPTREQANKYWALKLHDSVDGRELRESAKSSLSTHWIPSGSHKIPGREYVQDIHIHINAIPSRIRTSRGQRNIKKTECRAGCALLETTAHTIQGCWRTHGGRILRHDNVSRAVATELRKIGYLVEEEPHLRTTEGLRKPDIIAVKDKAAVIIDTQIVSGATALSFVHKAKRDKYGQNRDVQMQVADRLNTECCSIKTTTCTISWRGVWAKESHEDLAALGLKNAALEGLTTRALQGSYRNWTRFMQMTDVKKRDHNTPHGSLPRSGIG